MLIAGYSSYSIQMYTVDQPQPVVVPGSSHAHQQPSPRRYAVTLQAECVTDGSGNGSVAANGKGSVPHEAGAKWGPQKYKK